MSQFYDAELPYSDELAHHGIKGMHWYQRRFQNEDGSLTPAGRERYSKGGKKRESSGSIKSSNKKSGKDFVKGVASATLNGAARAASRLGEGVARGVKTKLAEKMPFMLNDEELERYRDRLKRENTFRNEIANRRDLKNKAQGDQFVKKLAQETIKTVANKATNKIMDNLLTTADEREKEQLDLEIKRSTRDKNEREASEGRLRSKINNEVDNLNNMREEKKRNERILSDNVSKINALERQRSAARMRLSTATTAEEKVIERANIKKFDMQLHKYDKLKERNAEIDREIPEVENRIRQRRSDLNSFVRDSSKDNNNNNS